MKKHIFLILNFNTKVMTENLINYIIAAGFDVVVVDNGSHDGSSDYFCEKFNGNRKVSVINSSENLGFARGNNLGYDFIKVNFKDIDFIHCINSDVEFIDITKFVTDSNAFEDAFVIGPNVLHNNLRTSPMNIHNIMNIKEFIVEEEKKYKNKILKHRIFSKFGRFYENHMLKSGSFIQTEDFQFYNVPLKENEYYVLNGAYIIFTKNYINTYQELFNPNTFLYYEEEILFYKMKKDNRKVVYNDEMIIIHNEGLSSGKSVLNKYKRLYDSLLIFKDSILN